jgi:hypothetical protein
MQKLEYSDFLIEELYAAQNKCDKTVSMSSALQGEMSLLEQKDKVPAFSPPDLGIMAYCMSINHSFVTFTFILLSPEYYQYVRRGGRYLTSRLAKMVPATVLCNGY